MVQSLFQRGDFTLNSGAKAKWKIECDAWTWEDIAALAEMIRELVGPFSHCVGVPRGGLRLATMLSPMATTGPVLIVDDVLTTGGSMVRMRERWRTSGDPPERFAEIQHCTSELLTKPSEWTRTVPIIGAVVFARGPCPDWVKSVFQMPEPLWLPSLRGEGAAPTV